MVLAAIMPKSSKIHRENGHAIINGYKHKHRVIEQPEVSEQD
jgi:hypothetical protein